MVPPYSHRVSRVRWYSGYSLLIWLFAYRIFTFFDWPSHTIQLSRFNALYCPNPEGISTLGLASSAFARHYWRNLCWFLFLALLRCFSSGGSPHMPMYSAYDDKTFLLPDCSIRTSTDISLTYSSPWLFAVSHVLHRLSVPRHSPCALCSLTIFSIHHRHQGLILLHTSHTSKRWLLCLVFRAARILFENFDVNNLSFLTVMNQIMRYLWFFVLVWK